MHCMADILWNILCMMTMKCDVIGQMVVEAVGLSSDVLVTYAITSISVVMEVLLHRKPLSAGNLELFFFACCFPSFILWKRHANVNFLLLWRTCMCPDLDV